MVEPRDEEEARAIARYEEQCNQFYDVVLKELLVFFPKGKVTYSVSYLVYFNKTDINEPDFEFEWQGKRYSVGPFAMLCDVVDPYGFRIYDYQTLESDVHRYTYLPPAEEWLTVLRKRFKKEQQYEQLTLF